MSIRRTEIALVEYVHAGAAELVLLLLRLG
jgi:hypothetical protein